MGCGRHDGPGPGEHCGGDGGGSAAVARASRAACRERAPGRHDPSIRIPAGDTTERKAYYQEVLTRVEEALRTGSDYYDASGKDPATQVLLSDGEFLGDPSGSHGAVRVHLVPFTGGTPDLLVELQSTLVAPLDKKLGNQLKRAKGHGYHTLLLLDQVGNQSMPAGTTWLPSAGAVGTIAAQRVAAYPGVLDAAVLAQPDDSLVQVFGNSI